MSRSRYAYRLGWRALRRVVQRSDLTTAGYKALARDLGQAMVDQKITTRRRARMFIAQTCHESGGYRWREELASGAAYEGRSDLGNWKLGDGRRFKGRSYIQITGRRNYASASRALNEDFIGHPETLAEKRHAARGAAWWWQAHGCNELADTGDFIAVTRRINGGVNGLADRKKYYRRTLGLGSFFVPKRRKP